MIATSDEMLPGIYTYFIDATPNDAGRGLAAWSGDADSAAWRLEPGDYLETSGGLVAATPELAAKAISWSRG